MRLSDPIYFDSKLAWKVSPAIDLSSEIFTKLTNKHIVFNGKNFPT